MNIDAFLKLPPPKRLAPVVVLAGDEPFFKDEAIAATVSALSSDGEAERREWRFTQARSAVDPAPILDELRTASLFSTAKLVLVRGAEAFLAAGAEAVVAYTRGAPAAPVRSVLVLDVSGLDKRTKVAKELERAGIVVDCKALYAEPPPWVRNAAPHETPLAQWTLLRARSMGLAVRPEVAHDLTMITGNDLYEIVATLEKLRLAGARELGAADVEQLAGRTRRDDAFAVAEAIGRGDLAGALASITRVFANGLDDQRGGRVNDAGAIGLITFGRIHAKMTQIRRTLAHLERGGGRSRDEVASAAGIPPFLADRALAQAERFRGRALGPIWRALLEGDLALKGAIPAGGPRAALTRLAIALLNEPRGCGKISAVRG